jgi:hypothetical protein
MNTHAVQRGVWWLIIVLTGAACIADVLVRPSFNLDNLLLLPAVVSYVGVGALIALRRPENRFGWLLMSVGLLLILSIDSGAVVEAALDTGTPIEGWVVFAGWFYSWAWFPLLMLIGTFAFLLYPSGLPSQRWRPVLWLSAFVTGLLTLAFAVAPTIDIGEVGVEPNAVTVNNPIAPSFIVEADPSFESPLIKALMLLAVICALVSIWSVVLRTWRSSGIEQMQLRLFAFAILLLPLHILIAGVSPRFGDSPLGDVTFTLIMMLIPLACGVAILRYRLYDIDRIIGRTTAYALVTAVLLAVYAVVVTSLTGLVPDSGSTGEADSWAVAVATLVAAGLFRPVLRWARRVVDRRFNREQFDAERAVEAFAVRLRDEVESDEVRSDLLTVLGSTVQPSSAGLWLKAPVP